LFSVFQRKEGYNCFYKVIFTENFLHMLDQIVNLIRQAGQESVVNNPEIPNEYNQEVLADATSTITNGFQNVMAGGGFENILELFKGGGNNAGGSGISGLVKNPIVTMMIGYFISKLVNKYKMSPNSASSVANSLIPNTLSELINQTNDPENPNATLDNLVNSLTGGNTGNSGQGNNGGSPLQNLLNQFTGGTSGSGGGFDLQDIIGSLTQKAQSGFQNRQQSGGLMDMIKGFLN
jgi:uncharacterized membrane protein YgcG